MEDILLTLLKLLIMVLVPVATSVLTLLAKNYVNAWIDRNLEFQMAENLKRGVEIITDSVNYVQQTYVNSLKEEKKFTAQAQKNALNKAKERALELMNGDIQNAIESSYGNLDMYIETLIESLVTKKHK